MLHLVGSLPYLILRCTVTWTSNLKASVRYFVKQCTLQNVRVHPTMWNTATNIITLYNTASVVHVWRCLWHFLAIKWRLRKLSSAPSLASSGAILQRLRNIICFVWPRKSAKSLRMRHYGGRSVWFDDTMLTATGLPPGSSSTVHIYTQTIRRTKQWNRIPRTEHT
jgi:hypothetical protein